MKKLLSIILICMFAVCCVGTTKVIKEPKLVAPPATPVCAAFAVAVPPAPPAPIVTAIFCPAVTLTL